MYKNGSLIREICEKFDINHNTVHDVVANRIWLISKCEKYFKDKEQIINLIKNHSKTQIQKILNISISRLNKIIKEIKFEGICSI